VTPWRGVALMVLLVLSLVLFFLARIGALI
jgi:hypothetical protein